MSVQPRRRRLLLGLAFLGFVGLGLPDGLLGVAWPSIRAHFGLPLDALGALLVAWTAGYVVSSFGSGRLLAGLGVGGLLTTSGLATTLSLLGFAVTPVWWGMVALGHLAGLGAGAIDAGLNTHVATHHGPRLLNWLHACYGVGAAAGPALMTAVLMAESPWQTGYAVVAAGQMGLSAGYLLTRRLWNGGPGPGVPAAERAPSRATLRLPAAWWGCAAFLVYTGLEAAAGAWLFTLLVEARGLPVARAGSTVSVYWGCLMAGRLLFGVAVGLAPVRGMLRGTLALLVLAAALLALRQGPAWDLAAVVLLGLAAGPVFPSLIATTAARVGEAHAANAIGFQVAAAALGQSMLPALCGILAERGGLETLGPALLVAAVVLFAIHEALPARARGAGGSAPPPRGAL
jgi:fucose permease